ncbi:MAG: peptidoglycan editing factor PgeF [Pseudomonadales bacterium]
MKVFTPVWPVPPSVQAIVTTRMAGNLATHVGSRADSIANREALVTIAGLPCQPLWLEQVHGNRTILAEDYPDISTSNTSTSNPPQADAAVTSRVGQPLAVLVADCLPIILASAAGDRVGVVHAGWRGLADEVIASAVSRFEGQELIAWVGPGIGACHYEVNQVVRSAFDTSAGFREAGEGHWMMDLAEVAKLQLNAQGVSQIYGGDYCTWCDPRFFSHRENQAQGRFAVIAWLA